MNAWPDPPELLGLVPAGGGVEVVEGVSLEDEDDQVEAGGVYWDVQLLEDQDEDEDGGAGATQLEDELELQLEDGLSSFEDDQLLLEGTTTAAALL